MVVFLGVVIKQPIANSCEGKYFQGCRVIRGSIPPLPLFQLQLETRLRSVKLETARLFR